MVGSDASVLTKLYFVLSCFQLTQNTQKKYFVVGSANCRDWNALWLFACTFLNISYKKNRALYFFLVLKGPDAAPFAVCQFNSHYHLEEEEPLWFYDLAYFVIVHTEILFFPHFSGVWWVTQVLWIWYSHWMSSWAARQSSYFRLTVLMCKRRTNSLRSPLGW